VSHAVLPLCDERFLDRVLRNARRASERTRLVRVGVSESVERAGICPPPALAHALMPLRHIG
jgi:hypothetical protein